MSGNIVCCTKPCPFCGGRALEVRQPDDGSFCFWCSSCSAHGPASSTPAGAQLAWDCRPVEQRLGERFERVAEYACHDPGCDFYFAEGATCGCGLKLVLDAGPR